MVAISENLKAALRRNANVYLVINISAGIVLALLGCITSVIGLVSDAQKCLTALVGVLMLAMGVGIAWYYWKRRVDVVALLEEHPERVVWVYKKLSIGAAYGVAIFPFWFVVFGLEDKHRVAVRLPARDADRLIEELKTQLRHATFGYSAELERRYGNNPQDLRRS
ncbi:MAG TPA: hypothetical protein PLJ78_17605 [Anaerolineae bacterium]|nr:hypothetical protein [Anaerolineae bacterium]HQK15748.1 hypothetical protein [Anaerolineae bacterium]